MAFSSDHSLNDVLAFLDESLGTDAQVDSEWDDHELMTVVDEHFTAQEPTTTTVFASPPPPQSTKQKQKKKRSFDPNKARNSRRFELIDLRKEVKDLELKLQQLQSRQQRPIQQLASPERSRQAPKVWEQICTRQLERRLKAERDNELLKKKCETARQVAKSVEKLVRKRFAQREIESLEATTPSRRVNLPPDCSSHQTTRIFDELAAGVEASYHEVDAVFHTDTKFPDKPTRESLLRDSDDTLQIEFFFRKLLPFSAHEIGDAWWRRWCNCTGKCGNESLQNVVVEKFGLEMRDHKTNASAVFYDQQILRRYVEDDRVVIVWRGYIEPLKFGNAGVQGVSYLEKGYVLITPHEYDQDPPNSSGETFSRMSTCYKINPAYSSPSLRFNTRVAALTEFVSTIISANMSLSVETVENMLVDQRFSGSMTV